MAFHSQFKDEDAATIACGCAVLPIRTTCRGPAPSLTAGTYRSDAAHPTRLAGPRARVRTRARPAPDGCSTRERARAGKEDIIDEVLFFFKANVLFRNFEVRGSADRLLVYLTLYVTECLKRVEAAPSKADAVRALNNMALESFAIPGDASFTLGPYFPTPENRQEAGGRPRPTCSARVAPRRAAPRRAERSPSPLSLIHI